MLQRGTRATVTAVVVLVSYGSSRLLFFYLSLIRVTGCRALRSTGNWQSEMVSVGRVWVGSKDPHALGARDPPGKRLRYINAPFAFSRLSFTLEHSATDSLSVYFYPSLSHAPLYLSYFLSFARSPFTRYSGSIEPRTHTHARTHTEACTPACTV